MASSDYLSKAGIREDGMRTQFTSAVDDHWQKEMNEFVELLKLSEPIPTPDMSAKQAIEVLKQSTFLSNAKKNKLDSMIKLFRTKTGATTKEKSADEIRDELVTQAHAVVAKKQTSQRSE